MQNEPRQADLIPIEDTLGGLPAVQDAESAGKYTAARLRRQKPELARAAGALLQAGYGLQDTADALGLHFYSVQALAAESPDSVAVGKKNTARLAGHVGRRALERVHEFLESATVTTAQQAQQLATVAGIALDKAQVLDGEPSEIVGHTGPAITDVAGLMAKLMPAQPVSAGESSGLKEGAGSSEERAIAIASGGSVLVAASRRICEREAEQKAEADLQAVDIQAEENSNPLTTDQAGRPDAGAQAAEVTGDPEHGEPVPGDDSERTSGRESGPTSADGGGGGASSRHSSSSDALDSQNFFEQKDKHE